MTTIQTPLQIFLADDDEDDRTFFSEAIEDINIPSSLFHH